ncbi:Voltage-gated Ion Channel (VIC) Superfamily [Phytophthora cinnamomi]|uniref:Voltage-gated Ion Channel (VIC) Superfamily n=1 Tax=Phytophthora cinnamomi TaxID=4785 RepID=UPI00355AA40F|nr:Voltage-gated Ion Channel (VIC) Superfamily [Phytophthora cinnamomi]
MDVAFFIDIILNFITGLPLPSGEVSYNFRVIVRAYMRGWFAVDFCSTLPFESIAKLFGVGDNAHAALMSAKLLRGLKVLRLFKLARIRRLGKVFANLEDAVYTNQSLVSLAKLVLTMLFIAHLVACLWYAVGRVDPTESWLAVLANDPAGHVTDPNYLQYVRSVYWAIVTMTTIGYGDIVGHNNYERMLNIAVMAVGVSFFGYVIGTISTLVTNLDVAAARYEERMTVVKEYIISRRMPKYIANKIRHHFEYFYQNRSVFNESLILKRLPSALRNEMIHHVHSKIVSSVKYFVKCPESLISDMIMAMRPFAILKDEYVYVEHEIAAHVFFIIKGKVQLVKTAKRGKEDTRLSSLGVGDHFGELEVYHYDHGNGVRICSAVAKSYCELTFLSSEAIQKISG